jgi:cysteine desulfurase
MSVNLPIYLDNNATTPLDPRVLDAMLPYFTHFFGNAASTGHSFGRDARKAVDRSRAAIASALNAADSSEVVFTSGATESDNLALKGVAYSRRAMGDHIITARSEHKAVLDSAHALEREGFRVTYLGVDSEGLIDLGELRAAMDSKTILVSIMAANNEIGVIQDIGAIGAICRERGVLFHTDATQAVGKIPFDVQAMNVDMASFTAHKIYGPKGSGGFYVRKQCADCLKPLIDGGGHERGFRSGTLNVPGIVGLARCMEICMEEMDSESLRLRALRLRLLESLTRNLGAIRVNGHPERRLPGHLNFCIPGVEGESVMMSMQDVAVSSTAACSSASKSPSHVLAALGLEDELAMCALRVGIGRFNTQEEIDYAAERISKIARNARELSGFAA